MRLPEDASAVRIFREKVMGKRSFAPVFERKNTMELLQLTALNENALVLSGRPDVELSTSVKAVSVNGIYPSLANVKNGRYPLSERRVVVTGKNPSGNVQRLLSALFAAETGGVIAEHGLIQP